MDTVKWKLAEAMGYVFGTEYTERGLEYVILDPCGAYTSTVNEALHAERELGDVMWDLEERAIPFCEAIARQNMWLLLAVPGAYHMVYMFAKTIDRSPYDMFEYTLTNVHKADSYAALAVAAYDSGAQMPDYDDWKRDA